MRLIITALLSFLTFALSGQNTDIEKYLIELEKDQDSITRAVFLDSIDLINLKLVFSGKTRQIWRSTTRETPNIGQFYDIRLKFKSNKDALSFHQKYLKENSEYGPEIIQHGVRTKGVNEFRAFKGADLVNQLVAPYGLQMYCYIFVVDNFYVKFYISCKKELEPSVIQPYLDRAVSRIKGLR